VCPGTAKSEKWLDAGWTNGIGYPERT
jgi:hypothetical protein